MYVNARAIIERTGANEVEILVQTRKKPHKGGACIELPGGRVNEFEPLLDALRREVREETGLEVTHIEGLHTRVEAKTADSTVECLQPFAVYQTTRGPVDSLGVYFRCRAEGDLLAAGDETEGMRWLPVQEIAQRFANEPEAFSWVDRAGLMVYMRRVCDEEVLGKPPRRGAPPTCPQPPALRGGGEGGAARQEGRQGQAGEECGGGGADEVGVN